LDSPLTPALSPKGARGKGSRSACHSKPEPGSACQVTEKLSKPEFDPVSPATGKLSKPQFDPVSPAKGKLSKLEFDPVFQATGTLSKLEFDPVFQVGVARTDTSVSPLSLRERVRVRGL
jgi:hypothetical protein